MMGTKSLGDVFDWLHYCHNITLHKPLYRPDVYLVFYIFPSV